MTDVNSIALKAWDTLERVIEGDVNVTDTQYGAAGFVIETLAGVTPTSFFPAPEDKDD